MRGRGAGMLLPTAAQGARERVPVRHAQEQGAEEIGSDGDAQLEQLLSRRRAG